MCIHRAMVRTGKACTKIPCYMHGLACRWFFVKKARSYVEHF